jgi:phage I-like protein
MEDWATQLASKDLAQFEAWAASAPVMFDASGRRQLASKTPPAKTEALDATERQVASMMGVDPKAFLATRNAMTEI